MKIVFFLLAIILLIGIEIAKVYFIMPFPGSQQDEAVDLAYFLHNYIYLFRILGILLIAWPAYTLIKTGRPIIKWTAVALLVFWVMVLYSFNFRFMADKMFYQAENKILVNTKANKVPAMSLVLGVAIGNEAKAYPIEIIGYHHQVRDTVGGEPVMVTYCTVCRTGRVYSPVVDGQAEEFRLVGMDHFNAMFEDSRTKSWWRQVSGEAITGAQKGKVLREIPSSQMTLKSWLDRHPGSLIMQPDSTFKGQYESLKDYDEGTMEGNLEGSDSLSWKEKSWVVGVSHGLFSRAYDWNDLEQARAINDDLEGLPLVVALERDSASFHVWNRIVNRDTLVFAYSDSLDVLIDTRTNSLWDWSGRCTEGLLKGNQLKEIQSYQEFWHSWRTFHPGTTQFNKDRKISFAELIIKGFEVTLVSTKEMLNVVNHMDSVSRSGKK